MMVLPNLASALLYNMRKPMMRSQNKQCLIKIRNLVLFEKKTLENFHGNHL
jgi:hypothetical protein